MAAPRKLVAALKAGKYVPSKIGKKAREAATRLREEREREQPPRFIGGSGGEGHRRQPPFQSTKLRTISMKHRMFYGTPDYNPTESARAVRDSNSIEEMERSLGMTRAQILELASLASRAHIQQINTGSAGELEIYLDYDFLFYH